MLREWWDRLSRVEAGSSQGLLTAVVFAMTGVTLLALVVGFLTGSYLIPLVVTGLGWGMFLGAVALRATVIEKAGNMIMPAGGTTPSVAQHSNIEAMEARGDYARAAAAYRQAAEADPRDVVACEKLARLATMELKDYDTAVWAWRQAERRVAEPRRQMGFALLVIGLYRDNLRDPGRAMVEMRKFLARWPDAPNAGALRAELDQMKAERFREP
jgi:regulator of sirC expression with transglutaminase-like and TPR domain